MITKAEIKTQIALGTADTPQQVAKLVKHTTDVAALEWAAAYKNTKVRVAAVKNPHIPVGLLLDVLLREKSKTVRDVLVDVIQKRKDDISAALTVIRYYPQLNLQL